MKKILAVVTLCVLCVSCSQERNAQKASQASEAALQVANANDHIQKREYRAALSPLESALSLSPDNSEYQFLYCLLLERSGEADPAVKTCYMEVINQLSRGSTQACEQDMNCVVAALMAESEKAEALKQHFLALPAPEVEAEMRKHILNEFDRQKYLSTILP